MNCNSCNWRGNGIFAIRHIEENPTHQINLPEGTMELIKILNVDKETKGTVRYSDIDGLNIYLRKSEVGFPNHPDKLRVTITEA